MQTQTELPPIEVTRVCPTREELAREPIRDVTWDATVEQLLGFSRSMLTNYVRTMHAQDMLKPKARVFLRGDMAFGVVYFIGSDRWLLLPLTGWIKPGSNVVPITRAA